MTNKKTRILLHPYTNYTNSYINNLKKYLCTYNKNIDIVGKNFKRDIFKEQYDIVYLNWIEGYVAQKNKLLSYIYLCLIKYMLVFWTKKNKIIVWTYHNKFPHESKDMKIAKKIMNIMFKYSNIVIVHSEDSKKYCESVHGKNTKIMYYPHPNYISNYKNVLKSKSNKSINIGFFGAIKPYKGIENIIDSFKHIKETNINLKIIGRPYSKEYKERLECMVRDDNRISLDLRFIDDDEISDVFSEIDILVMSYGEESFLISGSAILSFSMKTPIIAPKIGMFNDYKESEFVFLYEKDNYLSFENVVKKVSHLNKENINYLGEKSYKYVETLDWNVFIGNLFDKIENIKL